MKKSKIFLSLLIVTLLVLVVGNISSLATTPTQITANTNIDTNTNTNENSNTNTNTNVNTNSVPSLIGATNTNTNTNKAGNNTSNYASATNTNTSKLPYAGTNSTSIILIAIGFAVSAVYAYKKVTDYNI